MPIRLPTDIPEPWRALCGGALEAARAAGILALDLRARGRVRSDLKADGTIVTNADRECENLICAHLSNIADYRVIGEESFGDLQNSDDAEFLRALGERPYWLIDPIDGTRGYVAGNDHFCVNIALIEKRHPVLGVVYVPNTNENFLGIPSIGAWKFAGGSAAPIKAAKWTDKVRVLTSSRGTDLKPLKTRLGRHAVKSLAAIGSAIKLVRIAEGRADYHLRTGPTMKWDTAAPEAILMAAGGILADLKGRPLDYTCAEWQNPFFEAAGNGAPTPGVRQIDA